jgi:hypothetical protein
MANTSNDNAIGEIIGGMIAWDHALQNSLTDSHLDEAIDWAKRFRDLYDGVQKHNRDIYVQDVLYEFEGWRDSIPRKIEHLESMKMGGWS